MDEGRGHERRTADGGGQRAREILPLRRRAWGKKLNADAIIVGSGFGGAVLACRLSEAGRRVIVLERGRRWAPEDYPRGPDDAWIWDADAPERHNGWIDLRIMDDMWVAQGAGVGGGSLIYANISVDAPPEAFLQGWPDEIDADILAPHYARVAETMEVQPLPRSQFTPRTKLMEESAAAIGEAHRFRQLDLAVTFDVRWDPQKTPPGDPAGSIPRLNRHGVRQGSCMHCGNCDIGCRVQAKNTLDLNYLALAERAGAEIRPLTLVTHVAPLGDRWRVHFDRIEDGRRIPGYLDAPQLFLAAGSLGSTELLLRSRDQYRTLSGLSNALGRNWSSNGDFLTPAFYPDRRISPTIGPTITAAIDFLDGSRGGRFFVEDGGFPNVLGDALEAMAARHRNPLVRRLLRSAARRLARDPLDNMMPWFGQGIDGADGVLYLGRRWHAPWRRALKLDWTVARSERGVGGLVKMHEELSRATGGTPRVPFTWTVFRNLVTPHPLGGCNMAAGRAAGVVDHRCRVFGHPGLFVVDGSVIPRPIGRNPSKTIAALAERTAEILVGNAAGSPAFS